jgi:hypothetical protein
LKRLAHAKRRDLSEPEIVKALRRLGCKVYLQDGPVDLLVGCRGVTFFLEVKRGELAPAARPLTAVELAFFRDWTGGRAGVIRCVEEALCFVGLKPCREQQTRTGEGTPAICHCGSTKDDPPWFVRWRDEELARKRDEKKRAHGAEVVP